MMYRTNNLHRFMISCKTRNPSGLQIKRAANQPTSQATGNSRIEQHKKLKHLSFYLCSSQTDGRTGALKLYMKYVCTKW